MAELHRDPILGQWVIIHTDDSWGPEHYEPVDNSPHKQATCQFCPGKESMTPPEVDAIREGGTSSNQPGWKVRVVPNKFPALKIEGSIDRRKIGLLDIANGIGAHEVVIETPDHNKQLGDFSQQEIQDVLKKYQSRLIDLSRDRRFKYIVIFKNYGESAGTTVEHAHSQIIALPMIPKTVLSELEGAKRYFETNKHCVFCDMLEQELRDKTRIVMEDKHFVVLCPFVSRYPFECWILPKKHESQFSFLSNEEQYALAGILKETLIRLKNCLSNPSFNYYFHVPPVNCEHEETFKEMGIKNLTPDHLKDFHWHIEILPKLTQIAGFEWGTGFYIVRTSPDTAADYLRSAYL